MDEDAAEEARNEEELWSVLVDASNWIGGISRMSQGKSQKGRARSADWQHKNPKQLQQNGNPVNSLTFLPCKVTTYKQIFNAKENNDESISNR